MKQTIQHTQLSPEQAAQCGMGLAIHARQTPQRLAIQSEHGVRTFDALNASANQLLQALRRRGLRPGDAVALLCANRPEFPETLIACMRGGLRVTPVNWHLTPREISYIVDDCEARVLIGDACFTEALQQVKASCADTLIGLAVGGDITGFDRYDAALEGESTADPDDAVAGSMMLYTSGTTGHPKGVQRPPNAPPNHQLVGMLLHADYQPGVSLDLCTGPLYHAAPLWYSMMAPLTCGVGTVLMDRWDPEKTLEYIEKYRITHCHMVPTMFHRLLALPEAVRNRHDLSSLKMIIHGAAPCPIHVKRAMMEWVGPIIYEYYGGTEGGACNATPQEWLQRPGTCGKPLAGVRILGEQGEILPAGEIGTVYLPAPAEGRFQYFKDPQKTEKAYGGGVSHFTLGDMGYLDQEGYLYLCDRRTDLIISGGVNIYPAEVDAVFLTHPKVADACTIGIPDPEWGQQVMTVIEPKTGVEPTDELAEALLGYCRDQLARFKCPRRIEFMASLPRSEAGKILRRKVRDHYVEESA